MAWAVVAGSVITVGAGYLKDQSAKKDQKSALARRTPYRTPKELMDVINAQKAIADQGLPEQTLNYLTNQNDRAFNTSLGALQRLGGDANTAALLFDRSIQESFKIGSENTLFNMNNFSKFIDAGKYLAESKDAEWASEQGMIKDQQAAAQQRRLEANAQIVSGINAGVTAYSNYQIGKLYGQPPATVDVGGKYVAPANPQLASNTSSSAVRAEGALIGRTVIGFDPITGKPQYG